MRFGLMLSNRGSLYGDANLLVEPALSAEQAGRLCRDGSG